MISTSLSPLPEFPNDILSLNRKNILEKTISDPRRLREKMFVESFDNFRRYLEKGISPKKVRSIITFFQNQKISVTLQHFDENQVDIRITSTILNTMVRVKNEQSITMLCNILRYIPPKESETKNTEEKLKNLYQESEIALPEMNTVNYEEEVKTVTQTNSGFNFFTRFLGL